jgi:hypothetical protein
MYDLLLSIEASCCDEKIVCVFFGAIFTLAYAINKSLKRLKEECCEQQYKNKLLVFSDDFKCFMRNKEQIIIQKHTPYEMTEAHRADSFKINKEVQELRSKKIRNIIQYILARNIILLLPFSAFLFLC